MEFLELMARALYGIPEAKLKDSPLAEWEDLSEECKVQMVRRAGQVIRAIEARGYRIARNGAGEG